LDSDQHEKRLEEDVFVRVAACSVRRSCISSHFSYGI
jgi:hypothetical protein